MKRYIKSSKHPVVFDLKDSLMDVIDIYNGQSKPLSGDWETETAHEQQTIADAFNISLASAKAIMINELGFDPDDNFI